MDDSQTEHLIQAALHRQAETAPSAGPLVERLPALRSRRRQRKVMTGLAVVAVVGALAVPTFLRTASNPAPLPPAGSPTESDTAEQTETPGLTMRYTADWLPDGYTEVSRLSDFNGQSPQSRSWAPLDELGDQHPHAAMEHVVTLTVNDSTEPGWDVADELTYDHTINGLPTLPMPSPYGFRVSWMPDSGTVLNVSVEQIPGVDIEDLAYQVAESVRPDGESQLRPAIEAGWIPPSMQPLNTDVFRTSEGWGAGVKASRPVEGSDGGEVWLTAEVTPGAAEGAEYVDGVPVQVRGREGRLWAADGSLPGRLQVQLPDDRWLTIGVNRRAPDIATEENLIRFAEGLVFNDEPAGGWFDE